MRREADESLRGGGSKGLVTVSTGGRARKPAAELVLNREDPLRN